MLTRFALENRALVIAILLAALVAGPFSLWSHPSREDPKIVIRNAQVLATYPGMSADRVEDLITTPLEEKIREIPEVDIIASTSTTGMARVKITVKDRYTDMAPIWTDLRNKMRDIAGDLPEGTTGPTVFDDQGDVAMATIAVTAEGFNNQEIYEAVKEYRRLIYARVPGVRKVSIYGRVEPRVFVEFDNVRVARLGLTPGAVVSAIQTQNVILPGGRIQAEGRTFIIEPTGDFDDVEELRNLRIAVPGASTPLYLSDIARVTLGFEEPPGKPARFNGRETIVVGVSMVDQFDAKVFAAALDGVTKAVESRLPIGFKLERVTWQPDEIDDAVIGVFNNLWQTVLIVLAVVIAFLGLRTGLLVGALVPLVMLVATLTMRYAGIELERMSLAALIIALGLLIDNGIVIAEDLQGRIQRGEDRLKAAMATGSAMTGPLLAASLTTVFAFLPLMLMPGGAGEYTRSISLVIAIALLLSWVLALTVLILLCVAFLKAGKPKSKAESYNRWYYNAYRWLISGLVRVRYLTVPAAFSTLALGVYLMQFVPNTFFPASERAQLQIIVELPNAANSYATSEVVKRVEDWLLDKEKNPNVASVASYVGDGGPRFYLALDTEDGRPNTAYMLVTLDDPDAVKPLQEKVRAFAAARVPEAAIFPKIMSMGPNEAGLVEYRISGPDAATLKATSRQIQLAMRRVGYTVNVTDDWGAPAVTILVKIDQEAARRAGLTSEDVARALEAQLSGEAVSSYRVEDLSIPVVIRAREDQRTTLALLRSLNVSVVDGAPVPLEQVATLIGAPKLSKIVRRDLERTITVSAKNLLMSAAAFDTALAPEIAAVRASLPAGYRLEKGGEIEKSGDAQERLASNMPLGFALMLLVLIWQFNSFKKPIIIVLTIPLVITGVGAALLIAPGANFSFMGILGFLALAGIVINNAIVLIDRIDEERAAGLPLESAIIEAGVQRLRPIIMTTCTTALGDAPKKHYRAEHLIDNAEVIARGRLVGTLLTLLVVPCLYAIFFRDQQTEERPSVRIAALDERRPAG